MGLATPATVQKLQAALHAKAKCSPDFRFYSLYDKVHRPDVLAFAYRCCKANQGCAGIDGQTFADIEAYGPERWLPPMLRPECLHPPPHPAFSGYRRAISPTVAPCRHVHRSTGQSTP